MTGYAVIIGDNWGFALRWREGFPHEPFLGLRVDGHEVWVAFEPKTARGPIGPSALEKIRQAFEEAGESWTYDEDVFLHQAPTLAAGHRLARRVARILRESDVKPREKAWSP
jgi:hypothetical protein